MAKDIIEPLESFEDFIGQTVKVGDHVVYATTSGRSPVQKFAIVERIETIRQWDAHAHLADDLRWVGAHGEARFRVGVRELSNGRGFSRYDTLVYDETRPVGQRYVKDAKPARVTFPMRENIVKVVAG